MKQLASSTTPLGQIQRGLGSGYLWAIEQRTEALKPMIEECIVNDPRWDHQLDDRGDYYAQIILALGMDIEPLARQLGERDDIDVSTSDAWLALDILSALAKRGSDEAAAILRAYVAS